VLGKRASVRGCYFGVARDWEATLNFRQRTSVVSMNGIDPLEKAREAYERMLSGKAPFRVVLRMEG
jgi:alcohol dehydrogenase